MQFVPIRVCRLTMSQANLTNEKENRMNKLDRGLDHLASTVDVPVADIIRALRGLDIKNVSLVRDVVDFIIIYSKYTKED